CQQGHNIPYSF
nr:immunoglobulin light chain junction region [Macaca mulatta]